MTMRCLWTSGATAAPIFCDEPRGPSGCGPFCAAHAQRGIAQQRIAAGLARDHVGEDIWPMDERPRAWKPTPGTRAQRAATTPRRPAGPRPQRVAPTRSLSGPTSPQNEWRRAQALAAAEAYRPAVADILAAGAASGMAIMRALNERGVATPLGGRWSNATTQRLLARLGLRPGLAEPEHRLAA